MLTYAKKNLIYAILMSVPPSLELRSPQKPSSYIADKGRECKDF